MSSIVNNSTDWNFKYCPHDPSGSGNGTCDGQDWGEWPSQPLDFCIAQPPRTLCSMQISVSLVAVVIFFNVIKVICFAFALLKQDFTPLVTLGDAMSSFLEDPDRTTSLLDYVSAAEAREMQCRYSVFKEKNCWRCWELRNPQLSISMPSCAANSRNVRVHDPHSVAGLMVGIRTQHTCESSTPIECKLFRVQKRNQSSLDFDERKWFTGARPRRWVMTYVT